MNATLQVVADEGVAAVTHRRVAAVAGVPLAATTYWFTSKEDLITTAFEVAAERDIARTHALAAQDFAGGRDEAATLIAHTLFEELTDGRTMLMASYILMIEARHRPALREISTAWADAYSEAFTLIVSKLGSARPEADAKLLLVTIDGLLLKHLIGDNRGGREELVTLLREQLELLLPQGTAHGPRIATL